MRLVKTFALAMLAAVAAMAFIGASSASASIKELTACKAHETLCKSGNIIRTITAKATNPVLLGTLSQKCTSSDATFKEEGLPTATSIAGSVTTLTFSGCGPCEKVETFAPYKGSVSGGFLNSAGSAKINNCTFGIDCKFSTAGATLKLVANAEGLIVEARAEEEVLTLVEGSAFFCGSTGKWDANYVVSTPFLLVSQREVA